MPDRKIFHDSIVPIPDETGTTPAGFVVNATQPQDSNDTIELQFALETTPNADQILEQKIAKAEVVTPAEQEKLYTAKPSDVKALTKWLESNGFTITQTFPDAIYASAKAGDIAKALQVAMVRVTGEGVTWTSARNAPSLPSDVGSAVRAINGLQPHRRFHKHLRKIHFANGNRVSAAAPAVANAPPYLVSEILHAYGANTLGATGKGETIAILIDTAPIPSDLTAFWQHNGVNQDASRVQVINVGGGTLPPVEIEETLDASWTSGIAPEAAIRIYASGSLAFVDLDKALDRIIADLPANPGMRQLSISLGLGETYMASSEVTTQHSKYLRLAAAGVNVFVSSGDAGSNPSSNGQSSNGPLQVEYAASDTAVIGVGGTSLLLKSDGSVKSETGWTGSGGGASRLPIFTRPTWQTGNGVAHGKQRLVPDVSCAADPNTGAFLVLNGKPMQIGGTSWAAPVWAAFCALLNEARQKAGKKPLTFLPPLIYKLLGTAAFRDITSGNNGAFHCGSGYDQVTGLGAPNVAGLLAKLP